MAESRDACCAVPAPALTSGRAALEHRVTLTLHSMHKINEVHRGEAQCVKHRAFSLLASYFKARREISLVLQEELRWVRQSMEAGGGLMEKADLDKG